MSTTQTEEATKRKVPIHTPLPQPTSLTGGCPCACNSGGWCGGCGHAGCGGR